MPLALLSLSLPLAGAAAAAPAPAAASTEPVTEPVTVAARDPRVALLDAMATELARNQQQLRLQSHEPPYFLSYQLKDYDEYQVAARFGALFEDDGSRQRKLYVDARVGSYDFDSSVAENEFEMNFSTKGQSYMARNDAPLDDSPLALRTALWLATDSKYKSALFQFLKKKGDSVYTVDDPKRPPSFSKEQPHQFVEPAKPFSFARERWVQLARATSARFNAHPEIFDSEVRITADKVVRTFVSSEGARLITESTLYGVHISALTRAPDGQLLDDSRDFYAPTEAGLPGDAAIAEAAQKVITELLALREAPAIDPYTGPAILAPEAAGVLFHEAVGHRLEGERQDDDNEGKTFVGQLGKQMLPPFISLVDDPTRAQVEGEPLNGYYLYDDEGVKAQRADLVENGVLRTYLLSRHPVEGFLHSNGHGRSQGALRSIARMANLIVESKRQVSDAELKRMLIAEAKRQGKPYGLIIRDITGGNTNTSSYGYQAFKGVPRMVYRVDVRDGKETLVRGVEIVGTPLSAMNRILATGKKAGVFNGFCGAESGNVPVSTVAPSTLLQELELQRAVEGKDRPPLLPSPAAAAARAQAPTP
nr:MULTISPECIES: TldD/PmbA family protein [Myxococcaceae]